eukprot:1833947-Prymnesium_polylepis.1
MRHAKSTRISINTPRRPCDEREAVRGRERGHERPREYAGSRQFAVELSIHTLQLSSLIYLKPYALYRTIPDSPQA